MKRLVVCITTAVTIVCLLAGAAWYVMPPAKPADNQTPDVAMADVIATLFPPDGALLKGQTATIHTDRGGRIVGLVTRVLPERTPVGDTVVWLEGDSLDQHLLPGQRVAGEILSGIEQQDTIVVLGAYGLYYQDFSDVYKVAD